nr:heme biosynthesis protein HemY [Pseudaminobacter sp.]
AREAAEAAIRMQPREGAYLVLADIEEAETGDQGKVRQLLSKAVRAPRDPAWVADGFVSERWAPASPVTGRLDAFEWRVPVERLGQLIEQDDEPSPLAIGKPVVSAPAKEPDEHPAEAEDAVTIVEPAAPAQPEPVAAEEPKIVPPAPVPAPSSNGAEPHSPVAVMEPGASDESPVPEPRLPDDPGVDPEDAEQAPRRFRLF